MKLRSAALIIAALFVAACASDARVASERVAYTPAPTVTASPPSARPSPRPTSGVATVSATPRSVAVAAATPTPAPVGASVGGCPLFPEDNPWRRDVSGDPVDPRSDAYIASISQGGSFLHADFGSNPDYGIPFVVVPRDQ